MREWTTHLCPDCQVQRGGYGSRSEHPLPASWRSVAELGPAWCRLLRELFVCQACGTVHAVRQNHRDQMTDVLRLPNVSPSWFGEADPSEIVLRDWLDPEPFSDLQSNAALTVLKAYRVAHPEAEAGHGRALLTRLTEPRMGGSRAHVLLTALAQLNEPAAVANADALLAPHLVADPYYLPLLSELCKRRIPFAMSDEQRARLQQAVAPARVFAVAIERMLTAESRSDFRAVEIEARALWVLLSNGTPVTSGDCERIRALAERIAALPPDTPIDRADFGAGTPSELSAALRRLAHDCDHRVRYPAPQP